LPFVATENGQSLRDQIEKNDSKRTGPQNEDENEDQGSPRKKMRPNSGQVSVRKVVIWSVN